MRGREGELSAEQVELSAPLHLPFDELELGDQPFGLAVWPGLGHWGRDGAAAGDDAFVERCWGAARGIGDPGGQSSGIALAHHSMEALDQVARRDQYRHASLDACNGDRVAFGEQMRLREARLTQVFACP